MLPIVMEHTTKVASRERMAELVQDDAREDRGDEERASQMRDKDPDVQEAKVQ